MLDRKRFFGAVRAAPFGGRLTRAQVSGCETILDEWARRSLRDPRWLAYILATTFHETAMTMQPVRETGRGRGRAYGAPDPQTGHVYYGRGYVQLTWKRNYKVLGERLGADLVGDPDRALEPGMACAILFDGMVEGLFTGRALPDFFDAQRADWTGARAIVNGSDRAATIALIARQFHGALLNAADSGEAGPAEDLYGPKIITTPRGADMRNWGLLGINVASAIIGFAETLDWVSILGSQQAGAAVSIIAIANLVLRSLKGQPAPPAA